jgi:hypothetical protein
MNPFEIYGFYYSAYSLQESDVVYCAVLSRVYLKYLGKTPLINKNVNQFQSRETKFAPPNFEVRLLVSLPHS